MSIVSQPAATVGEAWSEYVARRERVRSIADRIQEEHPDAPRHAVQAVAEHRAALSDDDRLRFEAHVRARAAALRSVPWVDARRILRDMRSDRVRHELRQWAWAIGWGAVGLALYVALVFAGDAWR